MTIPTIVRTRGYHNATPTDEWGTPASLFRRLDAEFGFGLDVAASPENAKCARWYGRQADGSFIDALDPATRWLPHQAGAPAWLNPPYSKGIEQWTARAVDEWANMFAFLVLLLPVSTDTVWWQDDVMRASEIRLLRGRLRFEGGQNNGARFPSAVVIFRPWWKGQRPDVWGWDWRAVPTRA
jgi:phage N-6-adenine-methyltransferase